MATLLLMLFTTFAFAQNVVTGKVIDNYGEPMPEATVTLQSTGTSVQTDAQGAFSIDAPNGEQNLVIDFFGQNKTQAVTVNGNTDAGTITLGEEQQKIQSDEVVVVGGKVSAIVKERSTPVAVTTIKAAEVQQKIGNQEFPALAKSTPSVYVSNAGGAAGDSRIAIRGFDQNNIAVIINGQPVNDMESGTVYWSNWSGLSDIASAVQIQRGLGASKLVVPSVGGTFNVITKATDNKAGGMVKADVGNDRYNKLTASYSTGLNEKGWGSTFLLSRATGDGYINGTKFESYSWFFSVGYKPSEKHTFNLSATGAPQWHDTRRSSATGANAVTLQSLEQYGRKYNSQFGYLDGEEMTTSPNFYHKPIATFNWDWKINDKLNLTTVLYGSWGRGGGGSGLNGSIKNAAGKTLNYYNPTNGLIDYDMIRNYNTGVSVTDYSGNIFQKTAYSGGTGNAAYFNGKYVIQSTGTGIIRKQGINSHDWYGGIMDLNYQANDKWNINGGIDYRGYKGIHYDIITDFLGADAVYSTSDTNANGVFVTQKVDVEPMIKTKDNQKVTYDNDGLVRWIGAYGQVEYKTASFSAFLQASGSNQAYKRVDRFTYPVSDPRHETNWHDKWGYILKTGANYNINSQHNVFFNTGLISRQPYFNSVYNGRNVYNTESTNEKIFSLELGYGLRTKYLDANVNLYRTQWDDRFLPVTFRLNVADPTLPSLAAGTNYTANVNSLGQLHQGVELDLTAKPIKQVKVKGMFSYGDWKYNGNAKFDIVDQNTLVTLETNKDLYVDGLDVGDAAHITASLGVDATIWKGLSVDANWNYYSNLYASLSPMDFRTQANNDAGVLELPSYNLFDAGIGYKWKIEDRKELSFRFNVNNVFDTEYYSEMSTNIKTTDRINPNSTTDFSTYESTGRVIDGYADANRAFIGLGRTWNASVMFKF